MSAPAAITVPRASIFGAHADEILGGGNADGDLSFAVPSHHAGAPSASAGGQSPGGTISSGSSSFSVVIARKMLFERFPAKLKQQLAYRHFYTDEFDVHATLQSQLQAMPGVTHQNGRFANSRNGAAAAAATAQQQLFQATSAALSPPSLSLQLFSLFISYFCSLFRLEGRRKEYLKNDHSTKLGAEFSKAHQRTRAVFKRLTNVYATVVTTYNLHAQITILRPYKDQIRDQQRVKLPHNANAKPIPAVRDVRAFQYAADELQFYEELVVFTTELMRLAFSDEKLRQPISAEIARLFRSPSFRFGAERREAEVQQAAATMGRAQHGLRGNVRALAEALVPPSQPLIMKYALQQGTPLLGGRITTAKGVMANLKYMRPAFVAQGTPPSQINQRLEATFSNDTQTLGFPSWHKACGSPKRPGSGGGESQRPISPRSASGGSDISTPRLTGSQERGSRGQNASGRKGAAGSTAGSATGYGGSSGKGGGAGGSVQLHRTLALLPQLTDYDGQLDATFGGRQSPGVAESGSQAFSGAYGGVWAGAPSQAAFDPAAETTVAAAATVASAVTPPPALRPASPQSLNKSGRPNSPAKGAFVTKLKASLLASSTPTAPPPLVSPRDLDATLILAPIDPATGREDWHRYDAGPEIDSVYQSMANGVMVTSFGVPKDLLLGYDAVGVVRKGTTSGS